ncbi:MAG: diguanylate cyclase [Simplicispira sp.]|nr:diguanylate cyclase [Simplicispira sp.]
MHHISSCNVVDLLLDAVCIVKADSTIVFVSPAFERIFGYTPEEIVGRRMMELVHPEDLAITIDQAHQIMEGTLQVQFENRYLRKDGTIAHISWSARWLQDRQVRLAVAHDITRRKLHATKQAALYAISEAAHTAQNLQALFERIHQIIGQLLVAPDFSVGLYDSETQVLSFPYHANDRFAGASPITLQQDPRCAQVLQTGRTLRFPSETDALDAALPPAASMPSQALSWLGVPLQTQNGTIGLLVLQSYTEQDRYTDKDEALLHFVSAQVASAIERHQMHTRLLHMAQHDTLTNLPNRALLLDRLQTALARAQREHTMLSLLFVDLDDFKQVNDKLGHSIGDLLLQHIAQRLQACVRRSDTVARLGGDEFVVLLESGHSIEQAQKMTENIQEVFTQPFVLKNHSLLIRPSMGLALYPEHGNDADQLLNHADRNMYLAKQSARHPLRIVAATTSAPLKLQA